MAVLALAHTSPLTSRMTTEFTSDEYLMAHYQPAMHTRTGPFLTLIEQHLFLYKHWEDGYLGILWFASLHGTSSGIL
jgi:hypothetical protein